MKKKERKKNPSPCSSTVPPKVVNLWISVRIIVMLMLKRLRINLCVRIRCKNISFPVYPGACETTEIIARSVERGQICIRVRETNRRLETKNTIPINTRKLTERYSTVFGYLADQKTAGLGRSCVLFSTGLSFISDFTSSCPDKLLSGRTSSCILNSVPYRRSLFITALTVKYYGFRHVFLNFFKYGHPRLVRTLFGYGNNRGFAMFNRTLWSDTKVLKSTSRLLLSISSTTKTKFPSIFLSSVISLKTPLT